MIRKIKLKKGQIGATLTWVAAFLIIFFIIFLFVTASLLIAKNKEASVISESGSEGAGLGLSGQIDSFLNTPVEVDGEKIKISDLMIKIANSNPETRPELQRKLFEEFKSVMKNKNFAYGLILRCYRVSGSEIFTSSGSAFAAHAKAIFKIECSTSPISVKNEFIRVLDNPSNNEYPKLILFVQFGSSYKFDPECELTVQLDFGWMN